MVTLLKSLVQPKLDYCLQLWSPSDQSSINKLESVQHSLIDRIRDSRLAGLDYWGKLQELRQCSQERRRERYHVIFLWKISQGMGSGYDVHFTSLRNRRGRIIVPNPIVNSAPAMVRAVSGVRGAQLFNLLPDNLRSMNSEHVDTFRNHLDVFLSSLPDQPTVTGLGRAASTNSLLHQLPLFYNLTN